MSEHKSHFSSALFSVIVCVRIHSFFFIARHSRNCASKNSKTNSNIKIIFVHNQQKHFVSWFPFLIVVTHPVRQKISESVVFTLIRERPVLRIYRQRITVMAFWRATWNTIEINWDSICHCLFFPLPLSHSSDHQSTPKLLFSYFNAIIFHPRNVIY